MDRRVVEYHSSTDGGEEGEKGFATIVRPLGLLTWTVESGDTTAARTAGGGASMSSKAQQSPSMDCGGVK